MSKKTICPSWCHQCTQSEKIRSSRKSKTVCTGGQKKPLLGLAIFCKNSKKQKR